MKIRLAKSAGFCFGVKRALDIAHETAKKAKPVYMLGNIVHNEAVVRQMEKAGMRTIDRLARGKGKTLLIRAHGVSRSLSEEAERRGWRIVDATCPMVKEIHRIARNMEKKGYRIIVIGDREHDEVRGIIGQLTRAPIVIDKATRVPSVRLRGIGRAAVVVQSTQNLEEADRIAARLKSRIPNLMFFNTICRPTRIKQQEIKSLPLENDVMIVIGSKESANTRRLFEISRELNPRTYWVESEAGVKQKWFKDAGSVGITAGASTPDWITCAVVKRIRAF